MSAMLFFSHQVLHNTFQEHTFLMNGLIQGVKVGHFHICCRQDKLHMYMYCGLNLAFGFKFYELDLQIRP